MNKEKVKEILDKTNISVPDEIEIYEYVANLEEENKKIKLENKTLKEQMVAMVQPNYTYGIR